jgi:branched-chain amino acid transport system substrate-binding protein
MQINRRSFVMALGSGLALSGTSRLSLAQDTGPIRIGALNPITGSGSPYGTGMQKMILAAADAVNAAGGAAGRQIQVVAEDSQTNPQAAVLAAKKLIEVNQVQAIIGTWSSGVTLAVLPMCRAANIPILHTSGSPNLSDLSVTGGLGYRFHTPNGRTGRCYAEMCKREGFKRVATMAFNNASGLGLTEGFAKAWKDMDNDLVEKVVYEPNQTSYRSELMKVLAARPDAIVTGSYYADTTIIMREWFQTGQKTHWVIPGHASTPEFIKAVGPAVAEGVLTADLVVAKDSAAYAPYDEAYRKQMGQPGEFNIYAAMTWDMVIALALAIEAAGAANMLEVNKKIRTVANPPGTTVHSFADGKVKLREGTKIDYDGASSVLNFDENGDITPDFGIYRIENGALARKYTLRI